MLARPTVYVLKRLDPQDPAFAEIVEESRREGFWMLVRLADGWATRRNRFSRRGEAVFGAWLDGELAGVCGLNVDPYVEARREGRVRHLYVKPAHRRHGVGRLLVWAVIDKARIHFPALNLRAPAEAFAFYEALGFEHVEGADHMTHRMPFIGGHTVRRRKEA